MKLLAIALVTALCACASTAGPRTTAAAPPAPDTRGLPRYDLDVTLVPETHELRVRGRIVVPAAHGTLEIALMQAMTEVALTSTPAGVLSPPGPPASGAGNVMRRLVLPAGPPREVAIDVAYVSHTPSAFVYHIATDAMLAGGPTSAWYPQIARGGDGVKAVGQIRYHYPAGYRLIAGGRARDADRGGQRTTTVDYALPSTFSFIAAAYLERGSGDARAYVLRDRPTLAALVAACGRAHAVLSRELGPSPYAGFALVEAPASATAAAGFGGASFEGFMVATSDVFDAPFNAAFFGHEIGHQWWGNLVTKRGDAGGMLLGEGLAQYGSLRVVEALEGPAAAERYRRRGHPGYSDDQSGYGYLRYAAAGFDQPVAAASAGYTSLAHTLANSKGLLAFEQLARVIGRAQFSAALRELTSRHAFRAVSWPEAQRVFAAHAGGRSLAAVWAEWFDRTGAPDWELAWRPDGGAVARGAVVQRGAAFTVDIDVALHGAGGRQVIRRLALAGPRTGFELRAPFAIERIELDPRYEVVHWTPALRAEAAALAYLTRATVARLARAPDAAAQFAAALARTPAVDPYGARFLLLVGQARVLRQRDQPGDRAAARAALLAALAEPVRSEAAVPGVLAALARLADDDGDTAAAARYRDQAASATAAATSRSE